MSVTDLQMFAEIQAALQEDATFSNGLWSLTEVIGYFNQRQYRFLVETKLVAAWAIVPWVPGVPQADLPVDWIASIQAAWHTLATDAWTPLPKTDFFESDHVLGPEASVTGGIPAGYRETGTTETLSIGVSPAPAAPGELELIYTALSETLDGLGTYFTVPDEWVPYIKYGVYADMLGKTGRGQDRLRAMYAEQRYQEGLILAQALLTGWP